MVKKTVTSPKLIRLVGNIRSVMHTHQGPVEKDEKCAEMITRYCEKQIKNRLMLYYILIIAEFMVIGVLSLLLFIA